MRVPRAQGPAPLPGFEPPAEVYLAMAAAQEFEQGPLSPNTPPLDKAPDPEADGDEEDDD